MADPGEQFVREGALEEEAGGSAAQCGVGRTTSRRGSAAWRTASAPWVASPTTSVPGVLSSSMRKPRPVQSLVADDEHGRHDELHAVRGSSEVGSGARGRTASLQPPPGRGPTLTLPPYSAARSLMPGIPCPARRRRDARYADVRDRWAPSATARQAPVLLSACAATAEPVPGQRPQHRRPTTPGRRLRPRHGRRSRFPPAGAGTARSFRRVPRRQSASPRGTRAWRKAAAAVRRPGPTALNTGRLSAFAHSRWTRCTALGPG